MPQLTERLDAAHRYAREHHRAHLRKGTSIPYLAHLLAVTSLVLEDGGDEDEAIAALLHDVVEDGGGPRALARIRDEFGARVAEIVEGCSDSDVEPKPPWIDRKQAYLRHLRDDASDSVLRVSLADKLHNARAIVEDLRNVGDRLWDRFRTGSGPAQLWYYRSVADVMLDRRPGERADELDRTVATMAVLATHAPAEGPLRVWVSRTPPLTGWLHARTAWEAIALLATGRVAELSLDHDLGGEQFGRGVSVTDWLAERAAAGRPAWPRDGIALRTANTGARERMATSIERSAGRDHRVRRESNVGGTLRLAFG